MAGPPPGFTAAQWARVSPENKRIVLDARRRARRAAQRRTARSLQAGTFQPSPVGKTARDAARFIRQFDQRDRQAVIEMVRRGWWDNGRSSERRFTDTAQHMLNYIEYAISHEPFLSTLVNVRFEGGRSFTLFMDRVT